MNLLLARMINHYKISPSWQIYVLGFGLYIWSIILDVQLVTDFLHGVMPYPNLWDSYLFYFIAASYTLALCFTLLFRLFSIWIWMIYTMCLCYVIWHLPQDLITPDDWSTKHFYGFLDACYIVHSCYFFSKGLGCLASFLTPYFMKVRKWIQRF